MATGLQRSAQSNSNSIPPLCAGDRLTRDEFERRYRAMPGVKKAELIEGVVYMPSPVSARGHGTPHFDLIGWLAYYRWQTPGVEGGDNSTLQFGVDNEPQPDAFLRILPEFGGASRDTADGFIAGAPELLAEVSRSTASYDLHDKLEAYRKNGVREYLVWRVSDGEIDWFALRKKRFVPLQADAHGIVKSEVFAGLWLDTAAIISQDFARLLGVLQQGLATPEHARFVERLQANRR